MKSSPFIGAQPARNYRQPAPATWLPMSAPDAATRWFPRRAQPFPITRVATRVWRVRCLLEFVAKSVRQAPQHAQRRNRRDYRVYRRLSVCRTCKVRCSRLNSSDRMPSTGVSARRISASSSGNPSLRSGTNQHGLPPTSTRQLARSGWRKCCHNHSQSLLPSPWQHQWS